MSISVSTVWACSVWHHCLTCQRVSTIFFHTSASPLFFAASSAERWIVCSVSSSGDLRGIEIAFMSPSLSDKCTLMHMPFQNMPSAFDRFSLNRGQSCSSISGNLRRPFLVKSDLRSSRQEDWILKMYFFAFSCNTLACEHKNKMFEWFCICSEGSMPHHLENTTSSVSKTKGSFQSNLTTLAIQSTPLAH